MVLTALAFAIVQPPYRHVISQRSDGIGERVEVRDSKGKSIWVRRFPRGVATRWSEDGKAFAVFDGDFYLTTWLEGKKVQKHKIGPRPGGMGEPPWYLESLRWSPDKKRILTIVPGTSGDTDYNCGWLLVIRVGTNHVQDVDGAIRETAEWRDRRSIIYTGYQMVDHQGGRVFEHLPRKIARVK